MPGDPSATDVPRVKLHLAPLGRDADEPVGDLHGAEKGVALREHHATIYVGDHTADIDGARAAGAVAVSVATGPFSADELRAYGADVVLNDLTEFPAWLEGYVLEQRLEALMRRLSTYDQMVVAFSGGADSAFLLAAAARAIRPANVVAATAGSPSLPTAELEPAAPVADRRRVPPLAPPTHHVEPQG